MVKFVVAALGLLALAGAARAQPIPANGCPLSGCTFTGLISAAKPSGTGLAVTADTTLAGSTLLGSGTVSGFAYEFQTAIDYNPAVMAATNRRTMFNTTLNYSTANTTNIWEGVTEIGRAHV